MNIERIQKVTGGTGRRKETFESLALNIWRYAVNIVLILWLLSVFVSLDKLLVASSALVVVIGFAAKSMLDDITMGFFIIFEDLFSVGDFIEIDGNTGTVGRRHRHLRHARAALLALRVARPALLRPLPHRRPDWPAPSTT